MHSNKLARKLWGERTSFAYLIIASCFLLFSFLGSRDIWTQEHRWADIVYGMFVRHDFLHPYLGQADYYDKPLLSYWLIAFFSKLSGYFNAWILRLPSALAALLSIYGIYSLGRSIKNTELGLLAGWLLLTTYYFIFWGRTSSADMLNMAGSLIAVAWYFEHRDSTKIKDYAIFFIILALTSLCKGPIGAVVALIPVGVDALLNNSWQRHLSLRIVSACIPAIIIYVLPFWASSHFGGESYAENGLYLVYKENVLRYFQPFDHKGPIYTYLLYLPIYLLPWAFFFIPALLTLHKRWNYLSQNSKCLAWTLFLLFVFFTLSGSRRSYYVLALVPFGILFTADWILYKSNAQREWYASYGVVISFIFFFLALDVTQAWFYSHYGVSRFAKDLTQEVNKIKPWNEWQVVVLDAESKLSFYLKLPPTTPTFHIKGVERPLQTTATLDEAFPIIHTSHSNTIYLTRKNYVKLLKPLLPNYYIYEGQSFKQLPFMQAQEEQRPVAFIPNSVRKDF